MNGQFARTIRALEADNRQRWSPGLIAIVLVFLAWMGWCLLARISVYAASDEARLEAVAEPHVVGAPVQGVVVAVHVTLGQEVGEGDPLVDLDAQSERLRLEEEVARLQSQQREAAGLETEIRIEAEAMEQDRQATESSRREAQTRYQEAQAAADYAQLEAARLERLHGEGFVPAADLERARAESRRRRAEVEALGEALSGLTYDHESKASLRRARLEGLERQVGAARGEREQAELLVERLQHEVDLRQIRSPVAGKIGDLAQLRPGAVLEEGESFATVVPPGDLKVVARFRPADALGRIHPGQQGRMRFDGFPWIQFGTLSATVTRLGSELRDGGIEVELAPELQDDSPIPWQHGMPGRVEVEVERVSPATLVLRAAGRLISREAAVSSEAP